MLFLCLVALSALFAQRPDKYASLQTPLLLAAIALSYVVPWRLPVGGVVPWIVRGTLLFVMIMIGPEASGVGRFWFSDPRIMHLLGTLLAAELTVQHFLPYTGTARLGQMLIGAAGIMVAATSTFDSRLIGFLAPLFALAMMGVLRSFRPSPAASPVTTRHDPARASRRWLLTGSALALALLIGFSGINAMRAYKMGLNHLLGRMVSSLAVGGPVTGMSDKEILGVRHNLTSDPQRVLKIHGTNRAMHLRGLAFDIYSGAQWLPNLSKHVTGPMPPELILPAVAQGPRVERLVDNLGLVYLPLNTPGLRVETPAAILVEIGHRASVQATPDKQDILEYTFALPGGELSQGPLCRPLTDDERMRVLHVPEQLGREFVDLAKSLRQRDELHTINAIISNLHQNHKYSLNCRPGPGDPIADFVLNNRDAHCQYFASAATMMLRCNGIPARYVTGYFAHETASSNNMVVRACDAHAWCEAWIAGSGWVTVEATPASGTPPGLAKEHPISTWRKLREAVSDFFAGVAGFFRSLEWYHIAIAGASLTLIASAIQFINSRRQRRKLPPLRAYGFPSEQYRQVAQEFEKILRQFPDAPSGAQTWLEYLSDQRRQVSRLRTMRQSRLEAARQFVLTYNRIRFGTPDDPAALAELHRLLNEVRKG